jgi:hypothetical protein
VTFGSHDDEALTIAKFVDGEVTLIHAIESLSSFMVNAKPVVEPFGAV